MKTILLISIFIFTVSASFGQSEEVTQNLSGTEIRKELRSLINQMEDYGRIDSRSIGFTGKYTEQYKRFVNLSEKATDDELLALTEYKNAAIRGYAFWALAKRHYEDLHLVYSKHQEDTEEVEIFQGCSAGAIPLNHFMKMVVTPNTLDTDCMKFY